MARIPDRAEHQRRFMALSLADRRAIIRAVNRGRAVDERKHAPLAVGVARRQQRFWRYGWLIGPAMGVVQVAFVELEVALLNAAVGTIAIGLVAWYWLSRAQRAERLNLEIAEGGRRSGTHERPPGQGRIRLGRRRDVQSSDGERADKPVGRRPSGHLPSRTDAAVPQDPEATPAPRPEPVDPARPPYRPRGRKRRSRG